MADFVLEDFDLPKDPQLLNIMISHVEDMLIEGVTCITQQCAFCPFSKKYNHKYPHSYFTKSGDKKTLFNFDGNGKEEVTENLIKFLDLALNKKKRLMEKEDNQRLMLKEHIYKTIRVYIPQIFCAEDIYKFYLTTSRKTINTVLNTLVKEHLIGIERKDKDGVVYFKKIEEIKSAG